MRNNRFIDVMRRQRDVEGGVTALLGVPNDVYVGGGEGKNGHCGGKRS